MHALLTSHRRQTCSNQAGFTIVELMIATLVFSLVLLVITFGVIHFTNDYYRGINSSTTQTTAQNAIDTIAQGVQFSAVGTTATNGTEGFFCAGSKLFIYDLGKVHTTPGDGLYMMDRSGPNCDNNSVPNGTQLLGSNMRLTDIQVSKVAPAPANGGDIWQISIQIAYGDADLLCDGATPATCAKGATSFGLTNKVAGSDIRCKTDIGSHFCSVATYSTLAQQRIQ